MEQDKLFSIGTILLFITVFVLLIYGILYLITGSPAITGALNYIGKTEAEINVFDPELMIILSYELRVVGLADINLGIAYLLILNFGFRKKEKWAWIATLIATFGFVVPLILLSISVMGIDIDIIILFIFLFVQIVGEVMSYRSFFRGAE